MSGASASRTEPRVPGSQVANALERCAKAEAEVARLSAALDAGAKQVRALERERLARKGGRVARGEGWVVGWNRV